MDREISSADVQAKRDAALRWANHVNEAAADGLRWGYLLLSESDIKTANGSWPALKRLGSAQ